MKQSRAALVLILLLWITGSSTAVQPLGGLVEPSYATIVQEWQRNHPLGAEGFTIAPQDFVLRGEFSPGNSVTMYIEVPRTALYSLAFDYYIKDESILAPELAVQVNGVYPFYEARRIILPNLWGSAAEEDVIDRYGHELPPRSYKIHDWQYTPAYDASYLWSEPLLFKMEAGLNRVQLTNIRGDVELGNVYLAFSQHLPTYKEYAMGFGDYKEQSPALIKIEAEKMGTRSDSAIRTKSERDPAMTPYDTQIQYLNTIDGASFQKGGQEISWMFSVPETGLYQIAFTYKQDTKYDLPVFRRLALDGKVPFRELDNYAFPFTLSWAHEILSAGGGEPFSFFLEAGEHTLTMTVNLNNLRPAILTISEIMQEINELTLQIKRLTGNRVDRFRDWTLEEYIPEIATTLQEWAKRLEEHYGELNRLNPGVSEIGEIVNLKVAIDQLRKLALEPNEIPNRLGQLSQGSSSAAQLLGSLLERLTASPLSLDSIYVFRKHELPPAQASLIQRAVETVRRFILSFTTQQYGMAEKEKQTLHVWVNRSRPFVQLMQQMIDASFTTQSGISVQLSLMPDEGKLILARASKGAPDVALGLSNWLPYELAIRGAALDLRQFAGFSDVVQEFSPGALIPFVYEHGIYALPETQDFWVLFYRKDILESLGIPIPQTWAEVVDILPELQRFGMNFATPLATLGGSKPFAGTTPYLYQWGGELYKENGMSTAIDSEQALQAMRFMTELFTIYNLPQEIPNFYHHFRYGTLPIGISNFATYLQLRTAAPEIANSWALALYPGHESAGEVLRWAPGSGQAAMILDQTTQPTEAWEFLKWWLQAETQIEFSYRLQSLYGEAYLWNTANLAAFRELPWPEEHKQVVFAQFEWIREPSKVPGGYMLERELSNVWNRIVFDGENPRTTMDDAIIRVNREISRKMEEFGFTSYVVPTIDNIEGWLKAYE